jgi:hypothetical protein
MTAYWAYACNHNYGRIVLENTPDRMISRSSWINLSRWLYLKFTNIVLWLIYQLFWNKRIKKLLMR